MAARRARATSPRPRGSTQSRTAPRAAGRYEDVLHLQRTAGNRAVQRLLGQGPRIAWPDRQQYSPRTVPPPEAKFRVPTYAALKATYADATLAIPESVIKQRVGTLLQRMAFEKRLLSTDPVPTIVNKIFPGGGVVDQAEFEKAVDTKDRTLVYGTVLDAETNVKVADKAKLVKAFQDAAALADSVKSDTAGLRQVFGAEHATAGSNYGKAAAALRATSKKLDRRVTTDYNFDDPQVGLGGWADFDAQHIHLTLKVAQVADEPGTKTTLVHEGAHLSHPDVDDHGYYGSPNFEAFPESVKVANAAHYEELVRRKLGTSSFDGLTFTPGTLRSGKAPSFEDNVRQTATQHLRKAWDRAVDLHGFLRDVRKAYLAGDRSEFDGYRAEIMVISKKMGLTVHHQAAPSAMVTPLDLTLSEGVARAMAIVKRLAAKQAVPASSSWWSDLFVPVQVVSDALAAYGSLLGDPGKDLALVNWLAADYRTDIP